MNIKYIGLLIVIIVLVSTGYAGAHRLHVDWRIGKIQVESFYGGDGAPCQDALVRVYSSDGELLEEGKTDKEGRYSFSPVIWEKKYKIVLEPTHMPGHRVEKMINLETMNVSASSKKEGELSLLVRAIAGIGYLFGIAGISLAYMSWKSRKKQKG